MTGTRGGSGSGSAGDAANNALKMQRHLALAATIASLVVAGCASVATPVLVKPLKLPLDSGKAAEECLSLDAGERVAWRFESTVRVDFNLHFHRGREVVMPVDSPRTQGASGTFTAPARDEYCLMWKNTSAVPAFVTGELQRPGR